MPTFKFVAVGCTHAPITHKGFWQWFLNQLEAERPDVVVHLGDFHEALYASQHKKHPLHTWDAIDEFDALDAQFAQINEATPQSRRVLLFGNHDDNGLGLQPDRVKEDTRRLVSYRWGATQDTVLKDWTVKPYKKGVRFYLGQVSFGHGCPVTDASAKDEAYAHGVPYGLDIRAHTQAGARHGRQGAQGPSALCLCERRHRRGLGPDVLYGQTVH